MENQAKTEGNQTRPPVVVVLGHVDHGKTKILDYIRQTKVAEKEAGGITQHIGAYQIETSDKGQGSKKITFLDTPGHEAFSAIRSRGAKVADIAILVVAADEGVKPQTTEAIKIIEKTGIPFIVAINKMDKENANPQKVKQDLAENNVLVEEWGGKAPAVEISAKTGAGIDNLLEIVLLLAEMGELKNEVNTPSAVIIESHLDKRRGQVATMLVQNGVFKVNDWIYAGQEAARIKSLEDFTGKNISEAVASQPVVVLGWEHAPRLGETVSLAASREEALKMASQQAQLGRPEIFTQESAPLKNNAKTLNLIVKADVFSSLEAIDQVLKTIKSEEVSYRVVDFGLGDISEGDVKKAVATKAMMVGFHVQTDSSARQLAERDGVRVVIFEIIYELVEKVKEKMADLLDPEIKRLPLGKLKVLALFKKEGKTQVVGGKVTSGKIKRGALVDVLRNNQVVATGRLSQLQQQKSDVEEVAEGLECGIRFDLLAKNITPVMYIRESDVLEVYEEERIKRSI